MKTPKVSFSRNNVWGELKAGQRFLVLALVISLAGTFGSRAADNAGAQKLLAEAKAKETRANELRAAAVTAVQKATDDQIEAGAEERDALILTARALSMLGPDVKKERAYNGRIEARKLWREAHAKVIEARNAEARAAQQTRNAEELKKAAAQIKDQPTIASDLEKEAKSQSDEAQRNAQSASQDKTEAQGLEQRAAVAWAAADKLDPETARQLAPANPKPGLAEKRPAK